MAETVWEPTPEEAVARAVATQQARGLLPRQHMPRSTYAPRRQISAAQLANETGIYRDQVAGMAGLGSDDTAPFEATTKALMKCVAIFAAGLGVGWFLKSNMK